MGCVVSASRCALFCNHILQVHPNGGEVLCEESRRLEYDSVEGEVG